MNSFPRRNIFLLLLVVLVGLFASPIAPSITRVFAATDEVTALQKSIDEKNAKIKEIQTKIDSYKKVIDKKKLERASLNNQVDLITNRIQKTQLDIEQTQLQTEELSLELSAIEITLEDTVQKIRAQEVFVGAILRNMQSLDARNSIEVLASGKSLTDFFANVQQHKQLQRSLADSTRLLSKARAELEATKVAKESKKRTLSLLEEALQAKKESLSGEKNVKSVLIQETSSSEKKFNSLVDNLRREYERTESEISSIERQMRAKLDSKSFDASTPQNFTWPVPSRYITTYFRDSDYPYRHVFEHSGLDIRAAQKTPIRAANSGFVARAQRCSSSLCYSYTLIVHQNQVSTLYGHMSSIIVNEGDFVTQGDIIGYSGGTPGTVGAGPFVTGPHLHFETRVNGIPVNPLNYVQP